MIAEVKIFIFILYNPIIGCVALSAYTFFITTDDETPEALQKYFKSHSVGIVPGLDFGDPPNVQPQDSVFGQVGLVSYFLIDLIPLFCLIFIVKWTSCKNVCSIKNLVL